MWGLGIGIRRRPAAQPGDGDGTRKPQSGCACSMPIRCARVLEMMACFEFDELGLVYDLRDLFDLKIII